MRWDEQSELAPQGGMVTGNPVTLAFCGGSRHPSRWWP